MTTGDGSMAGGGNDGDFDDPDEWDDDLDDDLIEQLRQADPVEVEALPSSRSAQAMKTLDEILGPDDEAGSGTEPEAETGTDESSPSPAAVGRDGEEAPPPCPASQ
ncbi:MAG: hypothetical protein OXC00_08465 [Acidimicrobiaceae bacterium]|nr:hypothetical protein [Acidimicrobiaceae bacterium]